MEDINEKSTSRRSFLQMGAALVSGAATLAACTESINDSVMPSEAQRAFKRQGRSRVYIASVENYDLEVLGKAFAEGWKLSGPKVKNKKVFLKPNLVDYRGALPVSTNPAILEALISLLKQEGAAEIKIGDGPALNRDTEEVARLCGISAVCERQGVEFVDLNIDDLDKVENPLKFTGIEEFLFPRSVVRADCLISVPKLKTHHWALMTNSMKNMFGVVPGRKYGWPKNILHVKGINLSIVDLVASLKPCFAVVDSVTAMEGDGPLAGRAKDFHAVFLGDDLTAVDMVCGLCMEIPVSQVPYLRLAGMVLGNNEIGLIDLPGMSIDSVKKKFELPPTFEADGRPKDLSRLNKNAEQGIT